MKNFEQALKNLKLLNLPKENFTVVGGACLAAYNLRDCSDLDIVVTKELWNTLVFKYLPIKYSNYEIIKIEPDIEILGLGSHYLPNGFASSIDLISNSTNINGVNYAPIEFIKKIKLLRMLPKDIVDIELIDEYLGTKTII